MSSVSSLRLVAILICLQERGLSRVESRVVRFKFFDSRLVVRFVLRRSRSRPQPPSAHVDTRFPFNARSPHFRSLHAHSVRSTRQGGEENQGRKFAVTSARASSSSSSLKQRSASEWSGSENNTPPRQLQMLASNYTHELAIIYST